MAEEQAPLISKAVDASASGKQSTAVNVSGESQNAQREWDGPLWKMCGDCDQAGLSTFAYVKMCTPFAFGYVCAFFSPTCTPFAFGYVCAFFHRRMYEVSLQPVMAETFIGKRELSWRSF